MKVKKRKKRSSVYKLTLIADRLLRVKMMERDGGVCQKCGKEVYGSNCQMSHVYAKGSHKSMRWLLENVKTLCYYCHMHFWHSDVMVAREWFEAKFPDRHQYLLCVKNNITKVNEDFITGEIERLGKL
jgi:5-methylcytosine-specific restriction endonuclease McrA